MISILIGLLLLMVLAYLGWSIIWIAPIVSGVVALLSGLDLLPTYTDTYMGGFVGFAQSWFPIFLLGAIFGKLMEDTGSAQSVAKQITKFIGKKRAVLGVLVAAAVLTYGGVSLFVVVFAIYPISIALFREANVSRKLIPPVLVLGAFTFTMTAIPGTPQIQNLIPMDYFGTTPMSGPIIGIVTGLVMAVGGYFWLKFSQSRLEKKEERFTEPEEGNTDSDDIEAEDKPNWILSLIPLLVVVLALNLLNLDPIPSLLLGIVSILIINFKKFRAFVGSINDGAKGSVMATINTSAAVGFGSVVTAVPSFDQVTEMILGVSSNPLITQGLAVQILAMITGSASGGMGIALEALGGTYLNLAQSAGISPDALHRIAAVGSGASILPHNGALLTLFAVTGLTHKDCYKDVAMVGVVIPTVALIIGIIMGSIGIL